MAHFRASNVSGEMINDSLDLQIMILLMVNVLADNYTSTDPADTMKSYSVHGGADVLQS